MIYTEEKIGMAIIDNEGTYKIDHMFYEGLNGTLVLDKEEYISSIEELYNEDLTVTEKDALVLGFFKEQERRYGIKTKMVKMTITIEEL